MNLLWKKFPILNDGFICLADFMGNDSKIASRARTSYGLHDLEARLNEKLTKHIGYPDGVFVKRNEFSGADQAIVCHMSNGDVRKVTLESYHELQNQIEVEDAGLIRRLMRDRHTSPFEFCQVEFLVRAPIYVFRQWHRHRTASINEYSGRYKEMIDSIETTPPGKWRLQSGKNKQGSDGYLKDWPEGFDELTKNSFTSPGGQLSAMEEMLHEHAQKVYLERLALGVAKEQARKDLPVSNYSEMYWSCDLHNLLHFLTLRMDKHAQEEIRLYANQMGEIVKELFPVTWQAFEDYRLNAMQLTALDIKAIQKLSDPNFAVVSNTGYLDEAHTLLQSIFTNKTEREECVDKLTRLGIL